MESLALLVDDDPHTLLLMEHILGPVGCKMVTAADGLDALNILQTETPNMIFLDILMPHVTGLDVLNFIIETPRLNQMYVVVLSSQQRRLFADAPQLARADAYLVKPISPVVMRQMAQQVVASFVGEV